MAGPVDRISREVLLMWTEMKGKQVCGGVLLSALKNIGRKDLADQLENLLVSSKGIITLKC